MDLLNTHIAFMIVLSLSNEVSGWAVLEVFFCVHPGSAEISPHGVFPAFLRAVSSSCRSPGRIS
jgi:hypothetical protein